MPPIILAKSGFVFGGGMALGRGWESDESMRWISVGFAAGGGMGCRGGTPRGEYPPYCAGGGPRC